jgi:fructokinase
MLRRFRFAVVFVTCGERGAIAVNGSEAVQHPGFPVRVVDTVGAGDAFTAAATHCLLHEIPLEETLAVANRWAAWVASQAGAMPTPPQTSVPFR